MPIYHRLGELPRKRHTTLPKGDGGIHYEELIGKRREETLTSDEHAELIATTDRLEEANVFRVQCLAELARRRQVTISVLMDELDIKPNIYG